MHKDIIMELTVPKRNSADNGKIHVAKFQAQINIVNSFIAIENQDTLDGSTWAHHVDLGQNVCCPCSGSDQIGLVYYFTIYFFLSLENFWVIAILIMKLLQV